jgi:hypothetical protein
VAKKKPVVKENLRNESKPCLQTSLSTTNIWAYWSLGTLSRTQEGTPTVTANLLRNIKGLRSSEKLQILMHLISIIRGKQKI